MLRRTHSAFARRHIVRAADKKAARINVIADLLNRLHYDGKEERLIASAACTAQVQFLLPDPGEACAWTLLADTSRTRYALQSRWMVIPGGVE